MTTWKPFYISIALLLVLSLIAVFLPMVWQTYNAARIAEQAGLLGEWADQSCDLPPSLSNNRVRFTAEPTGAVIWLGWVSPNEGTVTYIQRAEQIGGEKLAVSGLGIMDRRPYEAVFIIKDRKLRLWFVRVAGSQTVTDGMPLNGQATPWSVKCD